MIGMPNVGKSTLLNAWVGARLSITTPKAHTTREKILGVMSTTMFQLVFCDTPGLLSPRYALQKYMASQLKQALEGSEVILFLVGTDEKPTELHQRYFSMTRQEPLLVALNKIDLCSSEELEAHTQRWAEFFDGHKVYPISAKRSEGLDTLLFEILNYIPPHPPYYAMEQLTDKSERFVAAEILRKYILLGYKAEVPYSTYVSVTFFKKIEHVLHIHAHICVERDSQKAILIGTKGRPLKHVSTRARKEMESFFKEKVFLRAQVEVIKNWKRNSSQVQGMQHN